MQNFKRLLLATLLACVATPAYADKDFDIGNLNWSFKGPLEGQHCVQIEEPSDPHAWHDNYLCSKLDYGLEWSYRGKKSGMVCTAFKEPAEPKEHAWGDNYLCAPEDYGLSFSNDGPTEGKRCVQIYEGSDPDTWDDNYLCGPDSNTNKVMGWIDGLGSNPLTVDGWACAYGNDEPIDVQLFAAGPIGEGRLIGGVRADRPSERAVAEKCGSNGKAHRFSIPITDSLRRENLGQSVWVHGISPVKGANLVIEQSGKFVLPTDVPDAPSVNDPDPYPGKKKNGSWFQAVEDRHRDPSSDRDLSDSKVIGYVDDVLLSPPSVSGWACLVGSINPVVVHLYVGGPMGVGQLLGQAEANSASEAGVGEMCQTGHRQYRFQFMLNSDQRYFYAGLPVYGYAFTRGEGPLGYHALSGNGSVTLPGKPLTAK